MATPGQGIEIPTYFASGAFAQAREQGSGILYDPEQLTAISDMGKEWFDKHLPVGLDKIAFVYRFGIGGHEQPEPDPSYYRSNPNMHFIPESELRLPTDAVPNSVTKAHIEHDRQGFQVQVVDFVKPLAEALAHTLVNPPAEDYRMKASGGAWLRQAREAFQPRRFSMERKDRFIREVVANYAGAIMLVPREPDS
jgi:hypothetical protein